MNGSQTAEARTHWFALWDGYLAVAYGVVLLLLLTTPGPAAGRAVAMGVLTLLVVWYAAFGRRAIARGERAARFAAGLLAGYAVAVVADMTATFALFVVVPLLVMSLPLRVAMPLVLVAHAWPVVWSAVAQGGLTDDVLGRLPFLLLGIALATFLGLFVTQVVRQSRQRAELIEELRRSREEQTALSREAGVAAERERLAKEIHDTLAQSLTSITTLVQAADAQLEDAPENARKHLRLARRAADESLAEARAFVAAGTPPLLKEHSLAEALRRAATGFTEQYGIDVAVGMTGEGHEVPTRAAVVVLRAVQESLANVAKHARGADLVRLTLELTEEEVRLRVQDNGAGFSPGSSGGSSADGHGLPGIRARAAEAGGEAEITSDPTGTTLRVRVPYYLAAT
nr:histidine kinase [Kibdelosporangium sp. MJ126-NF4]CEL15543.1 two-component system, sensor protein [Kibdelosporangium sp. MJ126-NF4]CTQ98209.1 two-component system, sensor protein [Kibdelosporangium sp. MJ126-NF4]